MKIEQLSRRFGRQKSSQLSLLHEKTLALLARIPDRERRSKRLDDLISVGASPKVIARLLPNECTEADIAALCVGKATICLGSEYAK